jgi:hypothetical protein
VEEKRKEERRDGTIGIDKDRVGLAKPSFIGKRTMQPIFLIRLQACINRRRRSSRFVILNYEVEFESGNIRIASGNIANTPNTLT